MIVTKRLEDSIRDFENRMRKEQQKQDDRTVFVDYDNPRIKTVENLYGDFVSRGEVPNKTVYKTDDRIIRFGFDTLTGFDEAITNLKRELREYDKILNDYQNEVFSINAKLDMLKKHPEDDITNSIETLFNRKQEVMESVSLVKEKIKKEEKNLQELIFARKEFVLNKRQTLKNDSKNRAKLLDEYAAKNKEVKELENKIYMGTANNFDRERLEVLKNSIIPDLEKLINRKSLDSEDEKVNEVEEKSNETEEKTDEAEEKSNEPEEKSNESDEKVNEPEEKTDETEKKDESDLEPEPSKKVSKVTKAKEKIKNLLGKRSTKIILGVAGLAGLAGLIYQAAKEGDATTVSTGIDQLSGTIDTLHTHLPGGAEAVSNAHDILSSTDGGHITQIFDSNDWASQGINPEAPHPDYFQNNVLGYVTPDNEKVPINQLQDIITASDNGVDISSVYYGDSNGIDGYGTQIQGMNLDDFINTHSTKSR